MQSMLGILPVPGPLLLLVDVGTLHCPLSTKGKPTLNQLEALLGIHALLSSYHQLGAFCKDRQPFCPCYGCVWIALHTCNGSFSLWPATRLPPEGGCFVP